MGNLGRMEKLLPPLLGLLSPCLSQVSSAYCKGDGHWKRNCPKYLEDKKTGKIAGMDKGISNIYVIEFYITSSRSNTWVFDK
jgi:hypothetical protein